MAGQDNSNGSVYLVGAGPGMAGLITVRGAELIKTADCIICDKLANPQLLLYAKPDAEIIHTPKRVEHGSISQDEITRLIIEKAKQGKTVVRLKGGDPCIFGRAAEELTALADESIDFEIIPGVTAGIAAAAFSGIMLTDRDYSSEIIFVTGRQAEGKQSDQVDWQLLAKFRGTIVFYMGIGSLRLISEKLIDNGLLPLTPASVITNISLPHQRTIKASVADIEKVCKRENIHPPGIIVIGPAAKTDKRFNWFCRKPLFGKTIAVTRGRRGNNDFESKIIQRAGSAAKFETIELEPLTETDRFKDVFGRLVDFKWAIFTSANGVEFFFDHIRKEGFDARVFGGIKIACIGTETAVKLQNYGIRADFVPDVFTSRQLGEQLVRHADLKGVSVLLLRSQQASGELTDILEKSGAKIDSVDIYNVKKIKCKDSNLAENISDGLIDWITFASPSSAESFFEQIDVVSFKSSNVKTASIGPVTTEKLGSLGVNVDVTAHCHTIEGIIDAIEGHCT